MEVSSFLSAEIAIYSSYLILRFTMNFFHMCLNLLSYIHCYFRYASLNVVIKSDRNHFQHSETVIEAHGLEHIGPRHQELINSVKSLNRSGSQ